jgi:hypothetical protein
LDFWPLTGSTTSKVDELPLTVPLGCGTGAMVDCERVNVNAAVAARMVLVWWSRERGRLEAGPLVENARTDAVRRSVAVIKDDRAVTLRVMNEMVDESEGEGLCSCSRC